VPLDINPYFREIVEQSQAVILAGGTMKPIEQIKALLQSGCK
jgi:Rad3-related DNA helicase